ncbi:hypothetical protein P43SY_011709 [Pythium insidiosum]|uniref:Chromo domain-containing protein n=1 Tax=Pythium insidiosum TaxID=114742 RepID=A0AAD5LY18_PYTIN|nr:hypothetical protein P43SY_011709 [Pythium insidiosum]
MKRLNPTFNVELLAPYIENPEKFRHRPIPKATPIIIDEATGEEQHIVEALLKKRVFNRQPEWLVKWHGLPDSENSWELERHLKRLSHWRALQDNFFDRQREAKSGGM